MGSVALGDLMLAGNLWIRIKIKLSKPFDFDWMGTGFTGLLSLLYSIIYLNSGFLLCKLYLGANQVVMISSLLIIGILSKFDYSKSNKLFSALQKTIAMSRFNDNIPNPGRQVLLIWLLSFILSLPVLILARTTEKIRFGDSEMIQ